MKVYVLFADDKIYLIYSSKIEALKHLELMRSHEPETLWHLGEYEVQEEY